MRSIEGLHLTDFDEMKIYCDRTVTEEMKRLRTETSVPSAFGGIANHPLVIAFLNVRSFKHHVRDLDCDPVFVHSHLSCIVETNLSPKDVIPEVVSDKIIVYRNDIPPSSPFKHGLLTVTKELNTLQHTSFPDYQFECICVLLEHSVLGQFHVLFIYRSPAVKIRPFLQELQSLLSSLSSSNRFPTCNFG